VPAAQLVQTPAPAAE
jgi:hypothetical protein